MMSRPHPGLDLEGDALIALASTVANEARRVQRLVLTGGAGAWIEFLQGLHLTQGS
jgi:hypothetical protein